MKNILLILNLIFVFSLLSGCEKQQEYKSQATEVFPPHDLFTVALFRMNNLNIAPAYFKDNWTTVLLGHAPCDASCLTQLEYLDAVTTGQKLFVFDNLASTQHIKELTDKFKTTPITMGLTASSTDYFFAHFDIEGINKEDKSNYFYLVNPNGALAYSIQTTGLKHGDIENEINHLIEKF